MVDKTVTLEIDLLKNENRNEFSYIDLVHSKLGSNVDVSASSENENVRLVELAKSLEKKYGNMITVTNKGKRRRLRVDDFIDLGEGYDSQDSFIDDSEAVELVVAPTLRTRYGGFFVNEGFLDSIEDRSMDIEPPTSAPKQSKLDLGPSSPKRPKLKKDKSKQLLERAVKQLVAPAAVAVSTGNKNTKNGLNTLDAVFDSVLSASVLNDKIKSPSTAASNKATSNNKKSAIDNSALAKQPSPPCPPLPEDLRSDMHKILAFKPSVWHGASKSSLPPQFDNELLRFDELMVKKSLPKMTKAGVYAFIANHFCMKTKTLVGRLRKLKELKADSQLEPMLIALKAGVSKVMPDILLAYNRDLANYQERLCSWEKEKLTNPEARRPGAPKKIFRWNADCRSLVERIVAFRMEATFSATGKYLDADQMRRFLHTLIPLWPDNWISVAALSRAVSLTYQSMLDKSVPSAFPKVAPASYSSKVTAPTVTEPLFTVDASAASGRVTTATSASPVISNRPPITSKPSASVAAIRSSQSGLSPVLVPSGTSNAHYVSSSNPQQLLTSLVGTPAASSGGKEPGVYMVQFATSPPPTSVAKKGSAAVIPLIDLTEGLNDSPPRQQALTSSAAASSSSPSTFSPPSIASKSTSPAVAARRIACGPKNTTPIAPPVVPAARAPVSSIAVSMGHLLGRTAVNASQQQQQTNLTLQAVSNIISAFQQQSLQKQRLSTHENVRHTTAAAPILMNRQHHQHQNSTTAQANTRAAPGVSAAQAWNAAPISYVSSSSPVYSTPLVQSSATISRPQLPKQQLQQQQLHVAFDGYTKLTEPYLNWSRQYNLAQGQFNDSRGTADRAGK